MKRLNLVPAMGIALAAALVTTVAAGPANRELIVTITDETNAASQQQSAKLSLRTLPNASVDVRLTGLADGQLTADDRFIECYHLASSIIGAEQRAKFAPAMLPISVGLMSAIVPINVRLERVNEATIAFKGASFGELREAGGAIPAGATLEGAIGFDGDEPTSGIIREVAYTGTTSLPSHATTCTLKPALEQA